VIIPPNRQEEASNFFFENFSKRPVAVEMDYSFDYFPVRESALGSLSQTNVARQHQAAYQGAESTFSGPQLAPRKNTTYVNNKNKSK